MGHYDVLGVASDASAAEVRRAYVALARRHHPDSGGSTERMQAVNAAWAVLGDPVARRRYDQTIRRTTPPTGRPSGSWSAGPQGTASPPHGGNPLDDLDDRPIHGGMVKLPPWLAMVPPGTGVSGLVALVGGLLLRLPPLMALGAMLLLISVMFFLVSPFVALAASQRRGNG